MTCKNKIRLQYLALAMRYETNDSAFTGLRISLNKQLRPAVRPSVRPTVPSPGPGSVLGPGPGPSGPGRGPGPGHGPGHGPGRGLGPGLGPGPRAIVEKSENVLNSKSSQNGLAYSGKS